MLSHLVCLSLPNNAHVLMSSLTVAYVPDWFPGAGFKVKAKEWAVTLEEMVQRPYQFVKDQMVGLNAIMR